MLNGMELPNQEKLEHSQKRKHTHTWNLTQSKKWTNREERKNKKEYVWRTRKLIKTKLYSINFIKEINTLAVLIVKYSGPFLKWTREELQPIDQKTRKIMPMHKALHSRDDVERRYWLRKEGRRLSRIEDSVDTSVQRLEDYIEKHREGLITAARTNADNMRTHRTTITRKQKREEKHFYGGFND